jgi:hypothetical protein
MASCNTVAVEPAPVQHAGLSSGVAANPVGAELVIHVRRPGHILWISPPSRSRRRRQRSGWDKGGGSGLSGAACCRARWGRCWLTCVVYSARTCSRWLGLRISIRSSSSRRRVPIHRSAIALARGARTGVRRMQMPSLVNTASKAPVNLAPGPGSRIGKPPRARRGPSADFAPAEQPRCRSGWR